ncbi:MAG: hypothetical protein JWN40_5240 [Phycisphaerales bacterium]|nr:hypothetical protein [Phycisphaerales bacterium]
MPRTAGGPSASASTSRPEPPSLEPAASTARRSSTAHPFGIHTIPTRIGADHWSNSRSSTRPGDPRVGPASTRSLTCNHSYRCGWPSPHHSEQCCRSPSNCAPKAQPPQRRVTAETQPPRPRPSKCVASPQHANTLGAAPLGRIAPRQGEVMRRSECGCTGLS